MTLHGAALAECVRADRNFQPWIERQQAHQLRTVGRLHGEALEGAATDEVAGLAFNGWSPPDIEGCGIAVRIDAYFPESLLDAQHIERLHARRRCSRRCGPTGRPRYRR